MPLNEKIKEALTKPNTLTLCRIGAIPIIIVLMYFPNRICTFIAGLFFSAAAITDYLDGYLARQQGLVSSFGKIMDPIIAETGGDVSASWLGKYKTGFQIAAIIPLFFHYDYFTISMNAIGTFFLWGALIFTIWSGADYFIRARHLLKQ